MDQIGPITRNVEDCAVVNAITGYDPRLTSAVIKYPDYTAFLGEDIGD